MTEGIFMPKLGLIMEEGTVLEWQAQEGESVQKGQIIVVIESDKTAYELQTTTSGILHILVPEGDVAPVGEVLGQVAESQEEYDKIQSVT